MNPNLYDGIVNRSDGEKFPGLCKAARDLPVIERNETGLPRIIACWIKPADTLGRPTTIIREISLIA
jgi:hypothetical protein